MKIRIVSSLLALAALFSPRPAPAAITNVIGWWHFGEGATAQTGVSVPTNTNNINFRSAFSFQPVAGAVLVAPVTSPEAVGGPLGTNNGTNTAFSTRSLRFGLNATQSSFWNTTTNPPTNNYGVEIWFLGQNKGFTGGSITWLFSTGGGQVALSGTNNVWGGEVVRIKDNFDGTSYFQAGVITGPGSTDVSDFGPHVFMDTNSWIHLALVNTGGTLSFYTNGVLVATNDTGLSFPAAGAMYIGTDGDNQAIDGFIDEERLFTFAPGQFTTNDLLLRPLPGIITQPATNTTVWNGGAVTFNVGAVRDPANTFKWFLGTTNFPGETNTFLYRPLVATADNGGIYTAVVSNLNYTNSFTTSNALLTVVPVQTNNANAYKSAVTGEPSLVAYFPMDGSTSATVSNVVDNTRNGLLELNAVYDGQTNRSFGERAVFMNGNGDVRVPANPAFEFGGGNGTVEALVYLTTPTVPGYLVPNNCTLFSVASADGLSIRYKMQVSADGTTLVFTNDTGVSLNWSVPTSLLNRFAHVAFVFNNTSNVTPYVDGLSLGSKSQTNFGGATGVPAWIGSGTTNDPTMWVGTIDELAVYSTALPANTIAVHNSKFVFGTNTSAPTIVSQPAPATLYAGGSPFLQVTVAGTPPFTYQWLTNSVPIPGATNASLTLVNTTTNSSATYSLAVTNPIGSTNIVPFALSFVAPPAGYAAKIMSDHPTAYWRLDEPSGTNLFDFAGVLNGSYIGAFGLGFAGAIQGDADTAAAFGGGRGQIPFSPALNPSSAYTVEFWAKQTNAAAAIAMGSQFRTGTPRDGFAINVHNGGPGWTLQLGNSSGVTMTVNGVIPVSAGNWYHVALVWDGSTARLYVLGQLDGSASGGYLPNAVNPWVIGVRNDLAGAFSGSIDEVAFYNYALTQSQLQSHVTIGLPITVSIAPTTNVVADSKTVGTPYDGRLAGTVWQAGNNDGTTTRNGVLQFSNAPQSQIQTFAYTNFDTPQGAITFWMRSAGTFGGGNEAAVLFHRRPGGGAAGIAVVQNDTTGTIHIQGANSIPNIVSAGTVSDNKWHHVAVVYDQTITGFASLYIDGNLDTSVPNAAPFGWTPGAILQFGRDTLYDGGYWRTYNGAMDDIRIYNRVLTGAEVSSIYGSNAIVDTNALVVRYNFDTPPSGFNVNWTYGTLQTAPAATGTYSNLFPAQFAPFPVAPHGVQDYFRAQQ